SFFVTPAKFRRSGSRPRSIRAPLVMPGLGPGIHEFRTRRRGDRGGESHSAASRLRVTILLLNSRMPGPSPGMTAEALCALRLELGRDLAGYVRSGDWLGGILHGDFGHSLANKRPVTEMISGRLLNTLFLAGTAAVVAVPVAVALGVLAALYRESWFDKLI